MKKVAVIITFPWQEYEVGHRLKVDDRVARRLVRSGVARLESDDRESAAEAPLAPSDLEPGESPTPVRKRRRTA